MYLSRIKLNNIRGFGSGPRRVDLDLRRPDGRYAGWTVIAGRNGSGKSTFLKAVALAIAGPSAARALQQSFSGWIRHGAQAARVVAELVPEDGADGFSREMESFYEHERLNIYEPAEAEMGWARHQHGPEPSLYTQGLFSAGFRDADSDDGPWSDHTFGWFAAGYGPYRRLSGHASDAQRLMAGPTRIARLASLFREDASLIESTQWLKELHLRRLEARQGAAELVESVLQLLNSRLLPGSTKVEGVDSEGLWISEGGVTLPLHNMSDGYRVVAALVLDLARQLYTTYEEFELVEQDDRCFVPYRGVVLIDEVELHLHVSWQRRIGFWLKRHFPNIQFIVTTHSPFVCQAADPKGLIRLPAPGEERAAEHVSDELYKTVVNGTVDEAVLTELFGLEHVHSEESEKLRERVAQLEARVISGESSAEEQTELERLSAQLPNTGSALVDRAVRKYKLDE